jgi:hypothetical protein
LGIFLNKSAGKSHWFRRKSRRKSLWRTGSFSSLAGCGSHGSRSRVLGFSGLKGRGFKLLDSSGAPPSPNFSPSSRSWRIGFSRVVGHEFYWFRVLSLPGHLWFTGSQEIASPASSGLVGATHRRIGLHLPQLSRSHLSHISRLSHLSVLSRSHLSISLLPQSLRLSLSYCVRARKGRKKKKKEEERQIRREKKRGRGGCCEIEGRNISPLIHSHTCGYG